MRTFQLEPLRALGAVRALMRDPDDLPQVFTIIDALSLDTLHRVASRLRRSEAGRRLLVGQPDIVARLGDRASLARLPEGSLARAYLAFIGQEKISANGIREASRVGGVREEGLPPELAFVRRRLIDTHDLWHVVTGYNGDILGELTLLAFMFGQVVNPAVALILGASIVQLRNVAGGGLGAVQLVREGHRRGQGAVWLPQIGWESLLERPLDEVRHGLGLGRPAVYAELRTETYKAAKGGVTRFTPLVHVRGGARGRAVHAAELAPRERARPPAA